MSIEAATDKTFYFAYGSNMSQSRLEERVGKVGPAVQVALSNYRFIFNKSGSDGTSKANIEPKKDYQVHGALYPLTQEQLSVLDIFEGAFREPYHYERQTVEVTDSKGQIHSAITYIATPERILKKFVPPSEEYLQFILNGYQELELKTDALLEAAKGASF